MSDQTAPAKPKTRLVYTEGSEGELSHVERPSQPVDVRLCRPAGGYVSVREALATYLGIPGARLTELGALPQAEEGQRLLALRYIIANGRTWLEHFAWKGPLRAAFRRGLDGQALPDEELEERIQAHLESTE